MHSAPAPTRRSRFRAFRHRLTFPCECSLTTIDCVVLGSFVFLNASPAYAQVAGIDGLVAKIQQFNTALVGVGGALAVTGFIWGVASLTLGLAGASKAIICLVAGLAIASAPQIVGFFTGMG